MVNLQAVGAVVALLLGGVFLILGIGPLIACFAPAAGEAGAGAGACESFGSNPVPIAFLVVGSAMFALSSYLLYREYGVIASGSMWGGGPGGPGGPGRYR